MLLLKMEPTLERTLSRQIPKSRVTKSRGCQMGRKSAKSCCVFMIQPQMASSAARPAAVPQVNMASSCHR